MPGEPDNFTTTTPLPNRHVTHRVSQGTSFADQALDLLAALQDFVCACSQPQHHPRQTPKRSACLDSRCAIKLYTWGRRPVTSPTKGECSSSSSMLLFSGSFRHSLEGGLRLGAERRI